MIGINGHRNGIAPRQENRTGESHQQIVPPRLHGLPHAIIRGRTGEDWILQLVVKRERDFQVGPPLTDEKLDPNRYRVGGGHLFQRRALGIAQRNANNVKKALKQLRAESPSRSGSLSA